jgi:uncharacterized protein YegP (UPF0339 family)
MTDFPNVDDYPDVDIDDEDSPELTDLDVARMRPGAGLFPDTSARSGSFQVYADHAGAWRWRLSAANGEVLATSNDGYASRQQALSAVETVKRMAGGSVVKA